MPVTSRVVHKDAPVAYGYATYYLGSVTASKTGVVSLTVPTDVIVTELQVRAGTVSGTSPSLTATLKRGTNTLATTTALTAAGTARASASDARVTRNSELVVDLTVSGTSPNFGDVCVTIVFRRGGVEFSSGTRF